MPKILEYASRMRQAPTEAERIFCDRVSGMECHAQIVIGAFIADFLFPEKGIVVELDGGYHEEPEQLAKDTERDIWMQRKGLTVIRIQNAEAGTFPLSRIFNAPKAPLGIRNWLARAVSFTLQIQPQEAPAKPDKKSEASYGHSAAKFRAKELAAKQKINAAYILNPHGKKPKAQPPAKSPEEIAQERRAAKLAKRHKHAESRTIVSMQVSP